MGNSEWFTTNPWLEYSQTTDSVFCFARRHFSVQSTNVEKSFTTSGYSKWKKGVGQLNTKKFHADYQCDAMAAWAEFKNI